MCCQEHGNCCQHWHLESHHSCSCHCCVQESMSWSKNCCLVEDRRSPLLVVTVTVLLSWLGMLRVKFFRDTPTLSVTVPPIDSVLLSPNLLRLSCLPGANDTPITVSLLSVVIGEASMRPSGFSNFRKTPIWGLPLSSVTNPERESLSVSTKWPPTPLLPGLRATPITFAVALRGSRVSVASMRFPALFGNEFDLILVKGPGSRLRKTCVPSIPVAIGKSLSQCESAKVIGVPGMGWLLTSDTNPQRWALSLSTELFPELGLPVSTVVPTLLLLTVVPESLAPLSGVVVLAAWKLCGYSPERLVRTR